MRSISGRLDVGSKLVTAYEAAVKHGQGHAVTDCTGCEVAAEGAFMRAMATWERFLESLVIDLMVGAITAARCEPQSYSRFDHGNRQGARDALFSSKYSRLKNRVDIRSRPAKYMLFHDLDSVAKVLEHWLRDDPISPVLRQNDQDIRPVLAIRHGIAHGTDDSQIKLRNALAMFSPLRTYPRPGAFFLARPTVGADDWLTVLLGRLVRWSQEMSP